MQYCAAAIWIVNFLNMQSNFRIKVNISIPCRIAAASIYLQCYTIYSIIIKFCSLIYQSNRTARPKKSLIKAALTNSSITLHITAPLCFPTVIKFF